MEYERESRAAGRDYYELTIEMPRAKKNGVMRGWLFWWIGLLALSGSIAAAEIKYPIRTSVYAGANADLALVSLMGNSFFNGRTSLASVAESLKAQNELGAETYAAALVEVASEKDVLVALKAYRIAQLNLLSHAAPDGFETRRGWESRTAPLTAKLGEASAALEVEVDALIARLKAGT